MQRILDGHAITTRRSDRILQWFSDNWPPGLEWPAATPRPAPSTSLTQASECRNDASSPSATQAPEHRTTTQAHRKGASEPATPADILEATRQSLERRNAAADVSEWEAATTAAQEAITTAMTLNADGQVACPNALCLALNVERFIYDRVVGHYADGQAGAHKTPRRLRIGPSPTMQMLRALTGSGDVRFASRQMAPAVKQMLTTSRRESQ